MFSNNNKNQKKNILITVIVGIILVTIIGVSIYSQNPVSKPVKQTNNMTLTKLTLPSGLIVEDQEVGTGEAIVTGQAATFNYNGTLENGTVFDSTSKPGRTPFTATVGVGQLIKGWDIGIAGSTQENIPPMKVGGKRKLTIPYQLAYGEAGTQGIPPKSTLKFDIELLSLKPMSSK